MAFWHALGGFHPITICAILVLVMILLGLYLHRRFSDQGPVPVSVNYFFTRKCNYNCEFCFHTAKTSHIEDMADAKRGLALLKRAGMRKINFAGGEPFLYKTYLAELLKYCKETLKLESVSIISNASKIDEPFLERYGRYIDILAVSCDSFEDATNKKIGRTDGTPIQVAHLYRVAAWCRNYNIMFKLNTVVCAYNVDEDMVDPVTRLAPFRWKVFQVLMLPGENDSEKTKRDARALLISDEAYDRFCARHCHIGGFTPEPNRVMRSSYLLVDEYMRFMDKDKDTVSQSILRVGVKKALEEIHWDEAGFAERGGIYNWSRDDQKVEQSGCSTGLSKELEW